MAITDITTPDCAVIIYGVLERFEAWNRHAEAVILRGDGYAEFAELWEAGMVTTGVDGAPILLTRPVL